MNLLARFRPRYQHTCPCCTYLGHYLGCDLYFCGQNGKPTVIARSDDETAIYDSGLAFMDDPHLVEAKERATRKGLSWS